MTEELRELLQRVVDCYDEGIGELGTIAKDCRDALEQSDHIADNSKMVEGVDVVAWMITDSARWENRLVETDEVADHVLYQRGADGSRKVPLMTVAQHQRLIAVERQRTGELDAALRAIRAHFPARIDRQSFVVNGGAPLQADGDDEFYSAKKVKSLLNSVVAIMDAAISGRAT